MDNKVICRALWGSSENGRQKRAGTEVRNALLGVSVLLVFAPAIGAQALSQHDKNRFDAGTQAASKLQSDGAANHPPQRSQARIRSRIPKQVTSLQDLRFSVSGFRIEGTPQLTGEAMDAVLEPWKDRELSFSEFEQAVHAVARYLRENGHPDAEVKVSRAQINNGMVAVAIQGLSPAPSAVAEASPPVAAVEGAAEEKIAEAPPMPAEGVSPKVYVKSFRFTGVTLASEAELQQVVKTWADRYLTLEEMQQSADAVAAFLRGKDYPLVQAYLPRQRVDEGQIEIAVQEGVIDGSVGRNGLVVTGAEQRIKPQIIENILGKGVRPGKPLKVADLEHGLLVANDLPAIKVTTELVPGSLPGTTRVDAKVEEGKRFSGSIWADNFGSRYVGADRLNGLLNLNSPKGYGEQYSLNLSRSSRMNSYKLAGQMPFGVAGDKIGASFTRMNVDIGAEAAPLNISGDSSIFSLYGTHPVQLTSTRSAYLSAGLDEKRHQDTLAGIRESDRRLRVASLTLSGNLLDAWRGQMQWGTVLSAGNVDLSGNANFQASDASAARTAGGFSKLNWNVSRLAMLGNSTSWSWYASLNGQFASKNLDNGEKFQLGGPAGVRAYPVGEGLGDTGFIGSLEIRRDFSKTRFGDAQLFGFVDTGSITQYRNVWGTALTTGNPNSYSLAGVGVGASLSVGNRGSLKLSWAKKMGSNPNKTPAKTDSDGLNNASRVWIIGNIVF